MQNFNLVGSTVPGGECVSTPQDIVNLIEEYMEVEFSDTYALFNYGSTTPPVDQQDRPWIKLNADGTLDDIYVYQGGAWRTKERFQKKDIVMFSGLASDITIPWALCNGQPSINGVDIPDLRDKFIVGAGNTYSVGDTGGESMHTLTISEIPSHNHTFQATMDAAGGGAGGYVNYYLLNTTITTTSTGGGAAHENRPPYYALLFKIYVGYS